jgi:hypothetical protein
MCVHWVDETTIVVFQIVHERQWRAFHLECYHHVPIGADMKTAWFIDSVNVNSQPKVAYRHIK